jgi:hypothetical protein
MFLNIFLTYLQKNKKVKVNLRIINHLKFFHKQNKIYYLYLI